MIKLYLNKFISYYKVGALLHWISLSTFIIGWFLYGRFLDSTVVNFSPSYFLWIFGISFFISNTILSEMDAWSRYQNYKQLKDQVSLFGYQNRLLKPMLHSRCQRDAAQEACNDLGYGNNCKTYFSSFGYKWYQIIPDFVFKYPLFFFSLFFWRTTFFTPYYAPKVDFIEMKGLKYSSQKSQLL